MITDSVIKSLGFSKSYLKSIQVLSGRDAEDYIMDKVFEDIVYRRGQFVEGGSWKNTAHTILKNAVTETGVEYLVATNSGELLAVAAFSMEAMDMFVSAKLPFMSHGIKSYLYLRWLAGNGKGGGVTLVNELMQIAEAEDKMLFLESTTGATSFYEQAGFQQSLDKRYYYWLPSAFRKNLEQAA